MEILLDPIRDHQNSQLSIVTKKENAPTVIDWNEKCSRTLADKAITFGDVVLRLTRESLSTSRLHELMYRLVETDLVWQLVRMVTSD